MNKDQGVSNSPKPNMRSTDHLCMSSVQFKMRDCFGSCRYRLNHENSSFAQLPWENEEIPWKNKRLSQSARGKLLIIVMGLDWLINASLYHINHFLLRKVSVLQNYFHMLTGPSKELVWEGRGCLGGKMKLVLCIFSRKKQQRKEG